MKFAEFFIFLQNYMFNISACPTFYASYDCFGNDIGSPTNYWFIGMTQSDCVNACLDYTGCVGVQYNPPYLGCWLKTAVQNCIPNTGNIITFVPLSK